jgi:hypothetical protein
VIRQRDRSDHDYPDIGHFPDIGQQLTWRLTEATSRRSPAADKQKPDVDE